MKIMWHSVPSDYPTGYGVQTGLFTKQLKKAGFEVTISSVVACMNHEDKNGTLVLSPSARMSYGNDMIEDHVQRYSPDVVLSMSDTFVYDLKKFAKVPWLAWQVIDSEPLLPQLYAPCKTAKANIAMSRFGQRVMKVAGFESSYVPLAYSKEDFFKTNRAKERKWVKDTYGVDFGDKFVVMMNAANMSKPSRKNFGAAFKAFKRFRAAYCKDAIMYCHSEVTGALFNGERMPDILTMHGLTENEVFFPHPWEYNTGFLKADYLRTMYNAANVLLCTSRGEGFGVPLIEAQACGTPVITVDFSSMPELTLNGISIGDYQRYMFDAGTEQAVVNEGAVVGALVDVLENPDLYGEVPAEITEYEIEGVVNRYLIPVLFEFNKSQKEKQAQQAQKEVK